MTKQLQEATAKSKDLETKLGESNSKVYINLFLIAQLLYIIFRSSKCSLKGRYSTKKIFADFRDSLKIFIYNA